MRFSEKKSAKVLSVPESSGIERPVDRLEQVWSITEFRICRSSQNTVSGVLERPEISHDVAYLKTNEMLCSLCVWGWGGHCTMVGTLATRPSYPGFDFQQAQFFSKGKIVHVVVVNQ